MRPGGAICGPSLGGPLNLISVIGVYAAICRKMGLPLRFPGPEKTYRALYQVTSADLLARATVWAGETTAAQNQIFNVTNGDTLRWQHMWQRIAKMFDMDIADPVPFLLTTYMADKRPTWDAIVKKTCGPSLMNRSSPGAMETSPFVRTSTTYRARLKYARLVFMTASIAETMFSEIYENLREMRILPRLPGSVVTIPTREVSTFDSQRKVSQAENNLSYRAISASAAKSRYRRTLERLPAIKAKSFLRKSDQGNAVAALGGIESIPQMESCLALNADPELLLKAASLQSPNVTLILADG